MNSKILFFAALFIAILSTPMAAQAITASANLSIFIGDPGSPNHEDRLTFDAQASFNPPTQINQNTPVSVSIMKTGQAGTPYTSQLNADCTSDCILGDYYFTSGSQVGVTYSDNTTLAITDYGTHTLHLLINEVPAFHGQVHHTDYGSTPATFTVNQPPSSYQCSDNDDNEDSDNPPLSDEDDPECHSDCDANNPLTYMRTHNSESVPPNGSCPVPPVTGTISASPSSLQVCPATTGKSNISWIVPGGEAVNVYVNGNPFHGTTGSGSQYTTSDGQAGGVGWLQPDQSYVFTLKSAAGSVLLDTVVVTTTSSGCSTPIYSCTGAVPSNADLCSDDNTGLSANTPITMVDSCIPNSIKCEYTCDVGYELSGGVCVVSASPSASIDAPDCSIAAGSNSCISSVSWSTSNIPSPSIRQNGTQFSTLTSSGGTSRILLRGTYTFTVYDGATERASDIAIAECEIGTIWNGSVCEINSVPSASIDAPDCTIIAGESSCTSSVSWNTQYISSPSVRQNDIPFSVSLSSTGTDRPLTRGTHIFTIYDGATLEASDAAIAECAPSAPWNGTICDGVPPPPPVVTLSASPTSITAGNSSTLTWTVTGTADSCFASNTNGYVDWSGWKSYNPTNNQSVSPALTTTYSIVCYNEGVESNTATAVVTVIGSGPTANINAPDCDILTGQSSCTSSVSWNTDGIVSASVRQNGTQFSTLTSSGGTSRILLRGTYTFTVYDGAFDVELDSDSATAECESGSVWNSSVCEASLPTYSCTGPTPGNANLCSGDDSGLSSNTPKTLVASCSIPTKCEYICETGYTLIGGICVNQDPDIEITADPNIIRSGDTAQVEIDIIGAVSPGTCTLAGAVTGTLDYIAGNSTHVKTTVPLTSSRLVQVTCGINVESVTISVIPTFQEI